MHFGDIDLELGGVAHVHRAARERHGIALEHYLDKARLRRRSAHEPVGSYLSRQAAAPVPLLAMVGRGWHALRSTLLPHFRRMPRV